MASLKGLITLHITHMGTSKGSTQIERVTRKGGSKGKSTGSLTVDQGSSAMQVFEPLVEKCKRLNRAMRIGTNHGSLSARILSYYGDTPRGMVESAFEFANICRNLDYHNFLFSMKASNPLVMVQAYRLLAEEMYTNGWDYPLHLGVTEVIKP